MGGKLSEEAEGASVVCPIDEDETRVGLFAVQLQILNLKSFMLLRKLVPRK